MVTPVRYLRRKGIISQVFRVGPLGKCWFYFYLAGNGCARVFSAARNVLSKDPSADKAAAI